MKRAGVLINIVGPAASGKTTLSTMLLEEFSNELIPSVSCTTRQPRKGEIPGRHYHFLSAEQFLNEIGEKKFFEWEEVHGQKYGTRVAPLDQAVAGSSDLLLAIDIRGSLNLKRHYPDNTTIVVVMPPSFSAFETRLRSRGESEEEIARRTVTLRAELEIIEQEFAQIDYVIVNEHLPQSYQELRNIYLAEKARSVRRQTALSTLISDFKLAMEKK